MKKMRTKQPRILAQNIWSQGDKISRLSKWSLENTLHKQVLFSS